MKSWLHLGLWACLFLVREMPASERPFLTVPKLARPPVIDGVIGENEWAHAAMVSGFMGATGTEGGKLLPQVSRVYLAHDGRRFYMALYCELPPGVKPSMQYRRRDEPVFMDNTQFELWLAPPSEGRVVTHQMIANAYGAIFDNRQIPDLGATEMGWDAEWEIKSTYETGKYWMAELAVDLSEFTPEPVAPERLWRGLFAVAWPQRSWPYTFGMYKNVDSHAWLRFADHGDAVQVRDVRSLLDNRLEPELQLVNANPREQAFSIEVTAGAITHRATVNVPANSAKEFTFAKDLPAFPGDTRSLAATVLVKDGTGKPLLDGDWYFAPAIPETGKPEPLVAGAWAMQTRVQFAPLSMGIKSWVDVLDYPDRDQLAAVRFTVRPEDGGPVVAEQTVERFLYDAAETYLWLPKDLPHGEYTLTITFLNPGGKVLAGKDHSIEHADLKKKFAWLNSRAGKDITVHPPFEPVAVHGRELRVWGREYEMHGAFPSQVTSQNQPMLAAPIQLIAETGGTREEAKILRPFKLLDKTPETVRFEGAYALGGLHFTLRGTLAFDGMLHYEMTADPIDGAVGDHVDSLYLSVPVHQDTARYFFSTGGGWNAAYGLTDIREGEKTLVWDSAVLGDFVPYVGVADDDRALQWFADNDHGWVHGEGVPCARILRTGEVVEIQINLVRKPGRVPAFAANFGFIASPVRPVLPGWRNAVLDFAPMAGSAIHFFYGPGHGATPIDLHDTATLAKAIGAEVGANHPDVVLRDLPPTDLQTIPLEQIEAAVGPEKMEDFRKLVHGDGSDPDKSRFCYFYNAQMYFEGDRSEAFRTFFPGEWQSDPVRGWFHLTPTESYRDFFAFHLDLWLKHWVVPGLYFDEVYLGPDANVFNGNGKVMPDGSVRPSFPLLSQRAYLHRMRQLFLDHGREPFLWVHTTDYMAPHAISAAEVAMFGENRSPTPGNDIIGSIPPLLLRSIGRAQKFGFVPLWMTMAGRGGSPWHLAGRQTLGWCWMHDTVPEVHTVFRGRNLVALRALWGIGRDDVEFVPYWNPGGTVRTDDEKFVISLWKRPGGRILLMVMNLHPPGEGRARTRVTLDPETLGLDGAFVVQDIESGPVGREFRQMTDRVDALFAEDRNHSGVSVLTEGWEDIATRIEGDWGALETLATKREFDLEVSPRNFRMLVIEPAAAE